MLQLRLLLFTISQLFQQTSKQNEKFVGGKNIINLRLKKKLMSILSVQSSKKIGALHLLLSLFETLLNLLKFCLELLYSGLQLQLVPLVFC